MHCLAGKVSIVSMEVYNTTLVDEVTYVCKLIV